MQSARSLERGDKAATPPPRPWEQPFPRAWISVQPAELRTGGPGAEGDERLSLSVGTPGKRGVGALAWELRAPRGRSRQWDVGEDSAAQPCRSKVCAGSSPSTPCAAGGAVTVAVGIRVGRLPLVASTLDTLGQFAGGWSGAGRRLLASGGTVEWISPAPPRDLLRALGPPEARCAGRLPGAEGAAVSHGGGGSTAGCAAAAAAISSRTVPPMESTWN